MEVVFSYGNQKNLQQLQMGDFRVGVSSLYIRVRADEGLWNRTQKVEEVLP